MKQLSKDNQSISQKTDDNNNNLLIVKRNLYIAYFANSPF